MDRVLVVDDDIRLCAAPAFIGYDGTDKEIPAHISGIPVEARAQSEE